MASRYVKQSMKLVFIHGWGFDARFWNALALLLPQYQQERIELGFLSSRRTEKFPQDTPAILIGHSLGFIHGWQQRQDWSAWVAINSFPRFVQTETQPGCVPAAALREMRMKLVVQPEKTLQSFYKQNNAEAPQGTPDIERLREGLDELRDGDVRKILETANIPGLVLAAFNDPLVPIAVSEELGRTAQRIAWHETGGHVLPQSDPGWCAEAIRGFLVAISK